MVNYSVTVLLCGHKEKEEDPVPCGHLINNGQCPDENCEGYNEGIDSD